MQLRMLGYELGPVCAFDRACVVCRIPQSPVEACGPRVGIPPCVLEGSACEWRCLCPWLRVHNPVVGTTACAVEDTWPWNREPLMHFSGQANLWSGLLCVLAGSSPSGSREFEGKTTQARKAYLFSHIKEIRKKQYSRKI